MKTFKVSLVAMLTVLLSSFTFTNEVPCVEEESAIVINNRIVFTESGAFYNPCGQEVIDYQGTSLYSVFGQFNNNRLTLNLHQNFQNLSATGRDTGTTYRGTFVQNISSNYAAQVTLPYTFTSNLNIVYTAPGSGNNYMVSYDVHITVSPTGDVTSSFERSGNQCI